MITKIGNKNYRKTVFIVVYKVERGKKIYFILKRRLHWRGYEFPKGGIEERETEEQAVRREVKEETGLVIEKITNHNLKGKYEYTKNLSDRKDIQGQTYSLYSACVLGGAVSIDHHEHSSYRWLEYTDALKILSYSDQKECLKLVNSGLK